MLKLAIRQMPGACVKTEKVNKKVRQERRKCNRCDYNRIEIEMTLIEMVHFIDNC